MVIEENKARILAEDNKSKPEFQQRIRPRYSSWVEGEKMIVEIVLPGVRKENVQIKGLKDYLMLRAIRESKSKLNPNEIDKILYSLDFTLDWDVDPDKTIAKYEEGLLRIEMNLYNPLEKSNIISINGKNINPEKILKACESEENYIIVPDLSRDVDYIQRSVDFEVSLPGVREENILLRILPEVFDLIALRDKVIYRTNYSFGANIIPDKTTASYSDGLLKIHATIHDKLDDAREIKF